MPKTSTLLATFFMLLIQSMDLLLDIGGSTLGLRSRQGSEHPARLLGQGRLSRLGSRGLRPRVKRRGLPKKVQREAFDWLHLLWALFNFLDSGSPSSHAAAKASVERASQGEWTAQHESYAQTTYRHLIHYCAHPRGTMERGPAQLTELIERIHSVNMTLALLFLESLKVQWPLIPLGFHCRKRLGH